MQAFLSRALVPTGSAVLFGTKFGGDAFDLIDGKPVVSKTGSWANFFRFGPDYVERYANNSSYGPLLLSTRKDELSVEAVSLIALYSRFSGTHGGNPVATVVLNSGGRLEARLGQGQGNRLGLTHLGFWDDSAPTAGPRAGPGIHAAGFAVGVGSTRPSVYAGDGVRAASEVGNSLMTGADLRPRASNNGYWRYDVNAAWHRLHAVLIAPFYSSGDQLAAVTQNPSALLAALHTRATGRLVLPRVLALPPRNPPASHGPTPRHLAAAFGGQAFHLY